MCRAQIKLSTNQIACVSLRSSNWRRTELWIRYLTMPTGAYPNKQQDHIHAQSFPCILIQTNTLHLKTCFRSTSTLQYIRLRTVSHETAHRLAEEET
jgi:hypothetical protein